MMTRNTASPISSPSAFGTAPQCVNRKAECRDKSSSPKRYSQQTVYSPHKYCRTRVRFAQAFASSEAGLLSLGVSTLKVPHDCAAFGP
eukprot:2418179-Amphidinium_carterae.1